MTEYNYTVFWADADGGYVGICNEFPGLSHFSATKEGALDGIADLVLDCAEMLENTEIEYD